MVKPDIYWGDIHNHNEIGYGQGSLVRSFDLAENALDFFAVTPHGWWPDLPKDDDPVRRHHQQGFDKVRANWNRIQQLVRERYREDQFVTLLGWEWHSLEWGDYCLYFPDDKQELYYADNLADLKAHTASKNAIMIPHRFAPYRAEDGWSSYYHRETRTHFDYPAFSISILLKKAESKIEYLRIVFVGTLKRYTRLNELEESLKGRAAGEVKIEGLGGADELEFPGRKGFSASYIKHLAGVQLERGLGAVLKS